MDLQEFDYREIEINDFSAIPAGKYKAVLTSSEYKQNKSGNGYYFELGFQIIDGQFKDRKLKTCRS